MFNLFKRPTRIFIEASDPLFLGDFLCQPAIQSLNPKDQAMALRRYLINQINRHRQSVTGPALKSNLEIKEELLTNPNIQQIIMDYAAENNISIYQAQQHYFYFGMIFSYNECVNRVEDNDVRFIVIDHFNARCQVGLQAVMRRTCCMKLK